MTHGTGKSDSPIVPRKSSNKAGKPVAEGMEGRGLAKENSQQSTASRTQGRTRTPGALERVRQAARKDRKQRFTALLHHVYDLDRLRGAYYGLKRRVAPGIDNVTWRRYGEDLEGNLRDLSARLRRGAYRAKPARRAYVPKGEGKRRPIGLVTLEDKIVQRAVAEVLNAVYEVDFLGFSYGFRPERGPHDALDALSVALVRTKVNRGAARKGRSYRDIAHRNQASGRPMKPSGLCPPYGATSSLASSIATKLKNGPI